MKLRRLTIFAGLGVLAMPGYGQFGGFGGPSILSRGSGQGGRGGETPVSFSAFAGVIGNFATRFNTTSTFEGSPLFASSRYGVNGMAGLSAFKVGRRSSTSFQLGANYGRFQRGSLPRTSTGGFLSLSHSRQLTRRVSWFLGAGVRTTNNSVQRGGFQDQEELTGDPGVVVGGFEDEIFDNRVYAGTVSTGLSFQKSNRLSFSMQGGAFGVERPSRSYRDARGFQGGGSMQYTLTRRTQVGAQYQYGTFYFPGRYGESQYMSAQGFLSRQFNRTWSASVGGGPLRINSTRLAQVQIDPLIALLTGQSTALEIVDRELTTLGASASLNGRWRRSGVQLSYMRGVRPGNAIYQTSLSDGVRLSYNYKLNRDVGVGLFATARQMTAQLQDIGKSRSYRGGLSVSYRLTDTISLMTAANVARTEITGRQLRNDIAMASVGLSYSPGELPFHIF